MNSSAQNTSTNAVIFDLTPSAIATRDAVSDALASGKTLASFAGNMRDAGDHFYWACLIVAKIDGLIDCDADKYKERIKPYLVSVSPVSTDSTRKYAGEVIRLARRVTESGIIDLDQVGSMTDLRRAAGIKQIEVASMPETVRHANALTGNTGNTKTINWATVDGKAVDLGNDPATIKGQAVSQDVVDHVCRIINERDALTSERDVLIAERDVLRETLASVVSERDALIAERDALKATIQANANATPAKAKAKAKAA